MTDSFYRQIQISIVLKTSKYRINSSILILNFFICIANCNYKLQLLQLMFNKFLIYLYFQTQVVKGIALFCKTLTFYVSPKKNPMDLDQQVQRTIQLDLFFQSAGPEIKCSNIRLWQIHSTEDILLNPNSKKLLQFLY